MVHEAGHLLAAKAAGMPVHEFAIGMGPTLGGFAWRGTRYNIRLLPLGGFVKIAGMDPDDDHPDGFQHKSVWARLGVLFAGPFMNFLLAVLLFGLLFGVIGIPVYAPVIGTVQPGAAADGVLEPGDRILQVNETPISNWNELLPLIQQNPGQPLELVVQRGQGQVTVTATPRLEGGVGLLGISLDTSQVTRHRVGFWRGIGAGFEWTVTMVGNIFNALGQMITGRAPVELSGPVGIAREINRAAQSGFDQVINIAGFLSINVAVFNLLPIPALDGARMVFVAIEGIRGRKLDLERENLIHFVGLMFLLLLTVFITYRELFPAP